MGDEEVVLKPNQAALDDEFLVHPHTGAKTRNPLLNKSCSSPVLFTVSEFQHNCLGSAMREYQCINVSEKSLRELVGPCSPPLLSPKSTLQRAGLHKLRDLSSGYEFVMALNKSTYIQPRRQRRPPEKTTADGIMVEKLNVEVRLVSDTSLRIESINEGLVTTYNKNHLSFQVKPYDHIVRVNDQYKSSQKMLEEILECDHLELTIRRVPQALPPISMSRRGSKASIASLP